MESSMIAPNVAIPGMDAGMLQSMQAGILQQNASVPMDSRENKRERRQQINQSIVAAMTASGAPLCGLDPLQAGHAGGADPEETHRLVQAYAAVAALAAGQTYGAASSSDGAPKPKKAKKEKADDNLPAGFRKRYKAHLKELVKQGAEAEADPTGLTAQALLGTAQEFSALMPQMAIQPLQAADAQQLQQQHMQMALMGGMTGMSGMGMASAPGMPGMQTAPGMQLAAGLQGVPGMHGLPGMQGLPGLHGVPGLHGLPGMQGLPGMPAMPGMQGVPGMPSVAGMQGVPGLPAAPGMPIADPMGTMSGMVGGMAGTMDPMAAIAAMNPMMASFSGSAYGQGAADMQALNDGAAAVSSFLSPEASAKANARLAMQYASASAQQVQLARQSQFHSQMKSWENSKLSSSGSSAPVEESQTRFSNGYRPTQLCKKFFLYEGCAHGTACTFAHSYEELHPASAELIDLPKSDLLSEQKVDDFETQEPHMRMKKKREMCQRFKNKGACLLESRCMFAHKESDLGKVELVYDDRVKTEICRKWETGKCVFGRYCPHAHGMEQIGRLKPPEEICRMSAPIRPKNDKGKDNDKS